MINNDNINQLAKIALGRINFGKYKQEHFTDVLDSEGEYVELMEILYKCEYIKGCGFFKPLSGRTIMSIDGHNGITITTKGSECLESQNSYIIL